MLPYPCLQACAGQHMDSELGAGIEHVEVGYNGDKVLDPARVRIEHGAKTGGPPDNRAVPPGAQRQRVVRPPLWPPEREMNRAGFGLL